jgi:hypothetical protein
MAIPSQCLYGGRLGEPEITLEPATEATIRFEIIGLPRECPAPPVCYTLLP